MQSIDVSLFRFINRSLSNPLFDTLMPFASDSPLFPCLFFVLAFLLIWKGGARGRICCVDACSVAVPGQLVVCDSDQTRRRRACARSKSCPTSSCASAGAAASACPPPMRQLVLRDHGLACLLPEQRLFHAAAGGDWSAFRGFTTASIIRATCWPARFWARVAARDHLVVRRLWQCLGPRWFPLWNAQLPLAHQSGGPPASTRNADDQKHPRRAMASPRLSADGRSLLLVRLAYLAAGKIELSEDEAYQWLWSKHLALSYYSKPLLIACAQFLGTHLWGDNEFGVRFFSPMIAAVLSLLVLRFMAREVGARRVFFAAHHERHAADGAWARS